MDHPNAGDPVLVADRDAWFQYFRWTDPVDAPPYATEIDIHKKPGFDPCELFFGNGGLDDARRIDDQRLPRAGRRSRVRLLDVRRPGRPDSRRRRNGRDDRFAPTIAGLLELEGDGRSQ